MHIEYVPNRNSRPTILLRQSYREGKKVKKKTIANLSHWSPEIIEGMKRLLRGEVLANATSLNDSFKIIRSRAYGHVACVVGTLKKINLEEIISSKPCRELQFVCGMVVSRVINPCSKLATARRINYETQNSSLGEELSIQDVNEEDLYSGLDWLVERQERIQKKLIKKHQTGSLIFLYDASSSYFEGTKCPIAKYGYSRDRKSSKLQINYGLLCTADGCPVAIEVFAGNTGDPKTFTQQVKNMKERYKVEKVVWIGDRGMITDARIQEDLKDKKNVDWITALRAESIQELFEAKILNLAQFETLDFIEVTSDTFPGERLVACQNKLLAEERSHTREELLAATEKELDKISIATKREKKKLKGKDKIGLKIGEVLSSYKMKKHFILDITEDGFTYARNQDSIAKEKITDGFYVIRTSLSNKTIGASETILAYKSLSQVERAFRSMKTVDLKIRPIFHYSENRVRAHVFLCMLAYYLEWHLRKKLISVLFDDDDKEAAAKQRSSPVAKATPSQKAIDKAFTKISADGFPVHSLQTLLADLSSITKNTIQPLLANAPTFEKITEPTPYQKHILTLLDVNL